MNEWVLYEELIAGLSPLEIVHELETLTIKLSVFESQPGDYHRQMLVKRVLLRKLHANSTPKE